MIALFYSSYLVKHSYDNAEQDDLWAELTQEVQKAGGLTANVTVKEVMDTWTKQTGYPILEVQRDYSEKSLTISQVLLKTRYLYVSRCLSFNRLFHATG